MNTQQLLKKNEFHFKKKYGQNFIQDPNLLQKIVRESSLLPNSLILEIGPGAGALTKELANTGNQVLCYEIDHSLKPVLDNVLEAYQNVCVEYADFLKVDPREKMLNYTYDQLYVVANLPYYITTPILSRIIDLKLPVSKVVVMVQKEVADRIQAPINTKAYNSFTIYMQYYFQIRKLFDVSRHVFIPQPNVDSSIVELSRREKPVVEVKDEDGFFAFVRHCFQFKRKNLRNNLKNYNLECVEEVLKRYGFNLTVRAEALKIEVLAEIYNNL